jgi:Helix-turn-helix domain
MSIAAILHVLQHSKTTKSHRLLLIHLADHATDSGLSWPSHSQLARETGYTRRWVISAVDDLLRWGAMKEVYNAKGQTRYQLPVYDTKTHTCTCEGQLSTGHRGPCELTSQAPQSNPGRACELSSKGVKSPACNFSRPNGIAAEPLKDEPERPDAQAWEDEWGRNYDAIYGG